MLVGSDIPLLTADHLREAARARCRPSGGVVLGPADDGGYYLIGMTRGARRSCSRGSRGGPTSVLTDTLRAAERIGVDARLVRSAYDVDTIDDLRRLERDLATGAGRMSCPAAAALVQRSVMRPSTAGAISRLRGDVLLERGRDQVARLRSDSAPAGR